MGGCLKNLVIATAGDVGPGKGNEQIRKWVVANGGRWASRMQEGVTHLIVSKDAWKKGVDAVKQAEEKGAWIVSYDWLEDSLHKKRKLAEKKYTWAVLRRQRKMSKMMKKLGPMADTKKFKEGCAQALEDTGSGTSLSLRLPAKSKSTFFAPALDELRKKREAREKEEQAQREAKAEEKAMNIATGATKEAARAALIALMGGDSAKPAKAASKVESKSEVEAKANAIEESTPTPTSWPSPSSESTKDEQEQQDIDIANGTPSPKREPSPFPASPLKAPPSHSTPPLKLSSTQDLPHPPPPAKNSKLTDLYHIYMDNYGFRYDLELRRTNPILNTFSRYSLRLYESNTVPHVYCTFVRYVPPGGARDWIPSAANITVDNGGVDNLTAAQAQLQDQATNTLSQHTSTAIPQYLQTTDPAPAEAARLRALVETPTPSAATVYKSLPCPMNSPFSAALLTFRHIFRDLTLLSWEERRDDPLNPTSNPTRLSTQRLRAQAFCIEPFIWWNRPVNGQFGFEIKEHISASALDSSYERNKYELPALDNALGTEGSIGSTLLKEAEMARRREEEKQETERLRMKEVERKRKEKERKERPNFKKPLFNGVNGVPTQDAWGRYLPRPSPGALDGYRTASPGAGTQQWRPNATSTQGQARTRPHPSSTAYTAPNGLPYSSFSPYTPQSQQNFTHNRDETANPNAPSSRAIGPLRPAIFTDFSTQKKRRMFRDKE